MADDRTDAAADCAATPAGQPPGRLDKRADDARPYRIDCAALLRRHEMLVRVLRIDCPELTLRGSRTRLGRWLEVDLAGGGPVAERSFKLCRLQALLRTTVGEVAVSVDVRVHGA